MGFADSIKNNVSNRQNQINSKIVSIAKELFDKTIDLTPVSDPAQKKRGELKNNWNVGIGSVQTAYTNTFDIAGALSKSKVKSISATREFFKKDGKLTMSNIVDYGYRAEYEGWPSPRWNDSKPYRMMANALTIVAAKNKR